MREGEAPLGGPPGNPPAADPAGDEARIEAKRARLRAVLQARAAAAASALPSAPADRGPAGDRVPPDGVPFPLAPHQRTLWALHALAPQSSAYHIGSPVALPPAATADAVRDALADALARHAALRVRFDASGGEPVQTPVALDAPPLAVADATGWTLDALAAHARDVLDAPFRLGAGPPVRAQLYLDAHRGPTLLVAAHHAAADAFTLSLLGAETAERVRAALDGRTPHLPPAGSYADHVRDELAWLGGPGSAEALAYWTDRFGSGLPALDLGPGLAGPRRETVPIDWSDGLPQRLDAARRRSGAVGSSLLAAALAVALGRHAAQQRVPLGITTTGRRGGSDRLVLGCFALPALLDLSLDGDPTFGDLVREAGRQAGAAVDHQGVPFERLAEHHRRVTGAPYRAGLQVLFSYFREDFHEGFAAAMPALSPVRQALLGAASQRGGDTALTVQLVSNGDRLAGVAVFDPGRLGRDAVASILGATRAVLDEGLDRPDRPVSALAPGEGVRARPEPAAPVADIEAALLAHADVLDGAVVQTGAEGAAGLAAFAVVPAHADTAPAELQAHLAARLPAAAVPARVVLVEAVPRTPAGEPDRATLVASLPRVAPGAAGTEPPRDATEARMAALFERLLGVRGVGRDGHFFRLGGHSLVAVQLVAEIEGAFGVALPLRALFVAPTVAGLADLVRRQEASARLPTVVPVQPRGTRTPLFCIPGAGGNAAQFYLLAGALGDDRPLFSVEYQGRDGEGTPHRTVGQLVAHALAAIREVQPDGPYALAGYSVGGLVALEVANALRAGGARVAFVGVLDTIYPRKGLAAEVAREATPSQRPSRSVLGTLARAPAYVAYRTEPVRRHLRRAAAFHRHRLADGRVPESVVGPYLFSVHRLAFLRHRPTPLDGPLVLFRTGDHDPRLPEHLGWDALARGGVEVVRVPGDHGSILKDPRDAAALAAALSAALDRAGA